MILEAAAGSACNPGVHSHRHIACNNENPPRGIEPFGHGNDTVHVERVPQRMQILYILFKRSPGLRNQSILVLNIALHAFKRCRRGNGELVKVGLELAVALESEAPHNAQHSRRIGLQPARQVANAREHIFPRMLVNRTNDLLALVIEMADAIGKADRSSFVMIRAALMDCKVCGNEIRSRQLIGY